MINRRTFLTTVAAATMRPVHVGASTTKFQEVKALTFDVFGTVFDWRSSIINEGKILGKDKGLTVDWAKFADEWAKGYGSSIKRVSDRELPWTTVEELMRGELARMLNEFNIEGLSQEEIDQFACVWQRLKPWPDSVKGLKKLKASYTIATLSNGNISMLTKLAKHADIEWDHILSAEHAKRYKPEKEVYLKAAETLRLKPQQIMMVAAHPQDLIAAANNGFLTALVTRPLEWGTGNGLKYDLKKQRFDLVAKDLNDMEKQLCER